jgi:S1/P1 Nuclease
MRRVIFKCLCLWGLWSSAVLPAQAWDASGHYLIGAIAYQRLSPAVRTAVDRLIHAPDAVDPVEDFIAAGVFADDLKQRGITVYNSWHYISQPYAMDQQRTVPPQMHNVVWAIEQCQAIVGNTALPAFTRGFFLRLLIHFVGDIHQPLHAINFFSKTYPAGDAGGNRYTIEHPLADNLHRLWDRSAGLYPSQLRYRRAELNKLANQLQMDYPKPAKQQTLVAADWARESYALAISQVYTLVPDRAPDQAYISQAQQVAGQRLTLAGYRLAEMLTQLFKDNNNA